MENCLDVTFLSVSINMLPLPSRTKMILRRNQLTIRDVMRMSLKDMYRIRNLGFSDARDLYEVKLSLR
jgi:hypothetical protein